MKLLPCGDTAFLLDCDTLDEALTWHAAIAAAELEVVEDLVPAARTVLIRAANATAAERAKHAISVLQPAGAAATQQPNDENPVVLTVTYDGQDLDEVGTITGLGADGVIAAHTGQTWRVAFCGFAPGFGYLVGDDARLHVPRRDEPRTRVPAGAVGLAGEFSGVYPRESPGGWQLIGRTHAPLWDTNRDPPALLRPGASVRFSATPC